MADTAFKSYIIEDRSYVAHVKREVSILLKHGGFSITRAGEIDIILAELTSNLVKFADTGELIYRLYANEINPYFEIFCIDSGPGNDNMQQMLRDGASTANTLGHGLGAINRLSDTFQLYSRAKWGTLFYSKVYIQPYTKKHSPAEKEIAVGAIQTCIAGETLCGDGYDIIKNGDETVIFVGDGLGHGPNAYDAVQTAIEAFRAGSLDTPADIIRGIHDKVKRTRGLVGTIAIYNHKKKQWRICGVGNVMARLFNYSANRTYMGHNGIIGGNIPNTMNDFVSEPEQFPFIILTSDGIKSRWDISSYPGLLKYNPSIISGVIYKDNIRKNDDTLVLTAKVIN